MDLIPAIPESVLYKVEIMLRSGFHPLAVKQQIFREEGVQVELDSIIALDKTIEKPDIPSITFEYGGTVINDPLEEARKLLFFLQARLVKRREIEIATGEMSPTTDSLAHKLYAACIDYAVKSHSIGVNPWADRAAGNKPPVDANNITLGEMLDRIRIERPTTDLIEGETREL